MKNVILAGISLRRRRSSFLSAMAECRELIAACGMHTAAEVVQQSESMDPHTAFRSGKLQELADAVHENGADGVVFLNSLHVQTAMRIAEACGVDVIDRTAVILRIFSQRARSRQAILQTEMARLQYDLPRVLLDHAEQSEHARSSYSNRGSGEMRSAAVERKYAKRIALLRAELERISQRRGQDEKRRSKTLLKRAALVGYTNAGKSSLLNCCVQMFHGEGSLTGTKDMLFATLDTSVRRITYDRRAFFMYDTVGFVSDLPHELVEAFQSTLDAARDADLLIHVVDLSDPDWQHKMEVTMDTLHQIHADGIPLLRVFSKADLVAELPSPSEGIAVSSVSGEGIHEMTERILGMLYPKEEEGIYLIPYQRMGDFQRYCTVLETEVIDHTGDGMVVKMAGERQYLDIFRHDRIKGGEYENSLGKV